MPPPIPLSMRPRRTRTAAFRANRDGPAELARLCEAAGIPLIHVSTDYVFDGAKGAPYVETDATSPQGVYGASKLAGEQAVTGRVFARDRSCAPPGSIRRSARISSAPCWPRAQRNPALRVVADQRGCPTSAPTWRGHSGHRRPPCRAAAGRRPTPAYTTLPAPARRHGTGWPPRRSRRPRAMASQLPTVAPIRDRPVADTECGGRRIRGSTAPGWTRCSACACRHWRDGLARTIEAIFGSAECDRAA